MPSDLHFFLAACQYPGGVLDRTQRLSSDTRSPANLMGPADASLERLASVGDARSDACCLILAGDQIYVDATAGLFDPTSRDAPLDAAYDRRDENNRWAVAASRRERIALIDDHEIEDNWEPSRHAGRDAVLRATLQRARAAFLSRQRDGKAPAAPDGDSPAPLWEARRLPFGGPYLLFVADTRTERSARDPARIGAASIMSGTQFSRLCTALETSQRDDGDRHKFIATPSMLLPWRLSSAEDENDPAAALRSDAWDGYPGSLHALLGHLVDQQIRNCVFLSGDEHIGCFAKATVRRIDGGHERPPAVELWSIHAGALYAPYPFANAVEADFADDGDEFEFALEAAGGAAARRYACRVERRFPRIGDGFVGVEIVRGDGGAPAQVRATYYDGLGRGDVVLP